MIIQKVIEKAIEQLGSFATEEDLLRKGVSAVKLVKYRDHLISIEKVMQLLSYAVGSATEKKLHNILEQVYRQDDAELCVFIDDGGSAVGIVGFNGKGASAEILHIAVAENRRNSGIGRNMIDELLRLKNFTELTAETDHDAVEFYRRYGFEIQSLGEKYPGVERFHCRMLLSERSENQNEVATWTV